MADASPSSAKDLEIVEVKEEEEEENEDDGQVEQSNLRFNEIAAPNKPQDQTESTAASNGNNSQSRLQDDEESEEDTKKVSVKSPSRYRRMRGSSNTAGLSDHAIRSRVFVGHLDTDQCTRSDVKELFEECGPVKAISLQNGYGFVQYEQSSSAMTALEELHGKRYLGMNLVVDKPLMWKKLDGDEPITTKYTANQDRSRVPHSSWPHRDSYRPTLRGGYHDSSPDCYDDPPPVPSRYRDPDYERYLELRYMEETLADRYHSDRYYAPRHSRPPPEYSPDWYDTPMPGPSRSSYARPRDDPYDQMPFDRERRPFSRYGYS